MNTAFDKMEFCAAHAAGQDESALMQTVALLGDDNWRVRYAAAVALGDRRDPRAVEPLLEALRREEEAPLFTQPKLEGSISAGSNINFTIPFPEGTTEETKEAWRRRGRLMQAACLALGAIGNATPAVLAPLHRYATDQACDYMVRAAACKALGQLARPESLPVLEQASGDEEWCTAREATKGIQKIKASI